MKLLLISNSTNAGEEYLRYPMPEIGRFLHFTGTILIGFFGEGTGLLAGGDWKQLVVQLVIALVAILYSAVITAIIAFALEKTIGWRVTEAQEVGGIDLADQGERAYDFAGTASSVLKEVK